MGNFHESYKSLETIRVPSDRTFGFALSGILAVLGTIKALLWSLWIGGFILVMAGFVLGLTFYRTDIVAKIKKGFLKIAPIIARFLNPVLMGILFVLCFIPGGLIMRAFKHDPLKRRFDPYATTYWTKREEHALPDPMKYQF
jgi:hypothetical protein